MSDAGRAKKKAHKVTVVSGTHGKGTPTGSRAGSPAPGASQAPSGRCPHATPFSPAYFTTREYLLWALLTGVIFRFSIARSPQLRLLSAAGTCFRE